MPNAPMIEVLVTVPVSEELLSKLRGISPRVNITVIPAGGAGDIPAETWARTEVLYTSHLLPKSLLKKWS